jgi:CelD/BcsL family acetyltransferase involved in cellulose biosynthesis
MSEARVLEQPASAPPPDGPRAGAAAPLASELDRNTAYEWREEPHSLRFVLGEFRLFEWHFPALVLQGHHTELPSHLAGLPLPLERLGPAAQAAVVPSLADETLRAGLSFDRRHLRLVERVSHHWIDLHGTHEAYLKQLSQKARHELRRKTNRLCEQLKGRLDYRVYTRPEEMREFHRCALQISLRTYQEQLLGAGLPAGEAFLRKIEGLAHLDLVRGYLLFDGDRPIAYGYCEAQGSALLYVNTGYEPEYRQLSPGAVLLGRMLESLFAEGRFSLLDLDWGEAQWKQHYATKTVTGGRVVFFRPTPRNLALVWGHAALNGANALVRQAFRSMGIKDALKRFFRSRSLVAGSGRT